MIKQMTAVAIAALALVSAHPSFAADKMMGHKMSGHKMSGHKMMHGKMAAYCAKCKMYYSASDAKKMKMMDPMGHKMTMMSMGMVPKTAKMGHMGGKMGHMMGGKMMMDGDKKMMDGDKKMMGGDKKMDGKM